MECSVDWDSTLLIPEAVVIQFIATQKYTELQHCSGISMSGFLLVIFKDCSINVALLLTKMTERDVFTS